MVRWDRERCVLCGGCVSVCGEGAIVMEDFKISIDMDRCTLCGVCVVVCPFDALHVHSS